MSDHEQIVRAVGDYYSRKVDAHGPTPAGADWRDAESQELRFRQAMRLADDGKPFALNDYGCGYGALASHLRKHGFDFTYRGFDVSEPMLRHARELHAGDSSCTFVASEDELVPSDFTVASGIFNVRLDNDAERWRSYVLATIETLDRLSTRGFAFNMLTSYSDADKMRDDLYYADPTFYFDLCKRRYSRNVALLHDYGLWEFTLLVRK